MAAEVPIPLKFQHLLSHTFPGFFSALTLFMLIDIWSPLDLTFFMAKDLTSLLTFVGFIFLIGSILGIIIDGIHHSMIEDTIFDKFEEIIKADKVYRDFLKKANPKDVKCQGDCLNGCEKDDDDCDVVKYKLTRHYLFNRMSDKLVEINSYLSEEYYCYSEFYSNTFIALIPFSVVAPFYLFQILEVPWNLSVLLGLFSLILACFCLNSSYATYKQHMFVINSIMRGYVNDETLPGEQQT